MEITTGYTFSTRGYSFIGKIEKRKTPSDILRLTVGMVHRYRNYGTICIMRIPSKLSVASA